MNSIADIAEIQRAAITSLNQRMADFEAHLKASSPTPEVSTIHRDFIVFKDHVWSILSILQQQIVEVSRSVDVLEMRHRKKFLLLGGVTEKPEENIADVVASTLQHKLDMPDLQPASFTVCHRMGVSSNARPRPVLLRFADPELKSLIWKAKTKLKGSPLVLSEFLTRQRQTAFVTARKLFGVTSVWTLDGNISIKLPDGKRRRVYSYDEVVALGREHGKSLEEPVVLPEKPAAASTPSPVAPQVQPTRSRRNIQKNVK